MVLSSSSSLKRLCEEERTPSSPSNWSTRPKLPARGSVLPSLSLEGNQLPLPLKLSETKEPVEANCPCGRGRRAEEGQLLPFAPSRSNLFLLSTRSTLPTALLLPHLYFEASCVSSPSSSHASNSPPPFPPRSPRALVCANYHRVHHHHQRLWNFNCRLDTRRVWRSEFFCSSYGLRAF